MKRRLMWVAVVVSGIAAFRPAMAADNLPNLQQKAEAAYYDADFNTAADLAGRALSLGLSGKRAGRLVSG